MKKLVLLYLFIVFTCIHVSGQTAASYGFSAFSSPFTSISSTGTSTTGISCDDCGICVIPLGFTFTYCGVAYTTTAAHSNGFLSLGGYCSGGSTSYINSLADMGSDAGGVGMLMPFWDDLYGINGGVSIPAYYSTTGPVGSRIFTFEWANWLIFADRFTPSIRASFQVKLYEGSNIIDFCYGPSTYSTSTNVSSTVGIGNSPTDYQTLPNVSAAPVPSSTTFTTTLATSPANGQVYRWSQCNSGTISGTRSICVNGITNLTDAVAGGTWTITPTTVATVSATGVVGGISAGTANITYNSSVGCYTVSVVTVNPLPGTINGTKTVCVGATTTLTDATAGTWSSSTPAVGTIGSTTGIVGGIAGGTTNITYTSAAGCYTVAVVTVNPAPAAISGVLSICVGASTSLTDATGGGTWSSSGTATVSATGVVTGVSAGTANITWTLPAGCFTVATVTVNPSPGTILGASTVCEGSTITLSDSPGGGTWSISPTTTATISPTGVVTGVSSAGGGVATVTYDLGAGCTATKSITVNLTPAAITGTMSVCVGSVTPLTDATTGGTWSSAIPTVGTVDGSGNVAGIALGTTVISYSIGSCYAVTVVTVNTAPGPISGALSVCETFTTSLSDGVGGGTWSSTPATTASVSATGVVTGIAAGTATISYVIGSCYSTVIVTVNTQPAAITGPGTVCVGSTTALTDVTAGGTWSSVTGAVGTVNTTGVVTGLAVGTTTISYTIGTCAASTVVTVNTQPGPILGTLSVCETFTTNLSDATAGGTWSSTASATGSISTTGVVTGVAAGTTIISYTIGTCYSTAIVTVNTQPAAITGVGNVCVGSTTALTDATTGGTWSSVTGAVGTVNTTGVVTGIAVGTTTISYTIGTCAAFTVVTVNTQPVAITGNTGPICNTTTLALTDATTGGTWSSTPVTVATVTATGLVTGTGVGTAVISYAIGTCAVSTVVTVNLQPSAITGTLTVCSGFTTQLTDVDAGGTWSSTVPAVGTVDGTGLVSGLSNGTTTISYTIGSCAATAVVTVNSTPVAITGTLSVCETFTTQLTDLTTGGTWSITPAGTASVSATGLVTGTTAGTATVSYSIGSCAATAIVTVNTQPAAITGAFGVCNGFTTQLSDVTAGGTWTSTITAVGTVDGTGLVSGLSIGTTTISYTLGTCAATAVVTVNATPVAITGILTVCETFTTQLTDLTTGGVWSSTPAGTASVSATGLVTGVAAGTATISYDIGGCAVTAIVTVNTQPAAITGAFGVCNGFTTQLSDVTAGGTWTSTITAVGTVDGTGLVSGLSLGTTTISYTLGTCAATAVVTVNATPVAITGVLTVCETFTTQLTDLTSGGVWSSTPAGTASVSATGLVTGVAAGTATISYDISGCAVTAIVTVNTQPAAIAGSPAVCLGLTTQLSDATAGGTWTSTITAVGTVDGTGLVSGLTTGTTTISYTLGTCAATVVVTVLPLPVAISGTKTVCIGLTTSLSDATGGGTWSASNGNATVGTTGLVTGNIAGTDVITYTIGTGCIVTTIVTINPLPAAISGATQVCLGSTVTLSDATAGGTWISGGPGIASITGTGVVTGNTVGVTTITYQLPTSCQVTSPMTVNPLPGAINGPGFVCPGSTITLTDASAPGTWSSSTPAVATIVAATGVLTGVASGTTTITFTLGTGCIATRVITVNPAPPAIITPLGDTTFCPGGFVVLTANTGVGLLYQWTRNTVALPGATGPTYTAIISGSFQVTETNSFGCSATSIPMLVTVDTPIAAISLASGTYTICAGTTTTLNATTGAGYTYQWLFGGVPIAGAVNSTFATSNPGDFSVIVTNATGCSATSNVITISINPVPTAGVVLSGPITFCIGGSVSLTADYSSDYTYQWYNAAGAISGATTQSYTATTSDGYYVVVTNSFGCTTTSVTTNVVANPLPDVTITPSGPTLFCAGGSVTLNSVAVAGDTYQWFVGGTAITGATSSSYLVTASGGYRVQVTNPTTGCSAETLADTVVTVVAAPVIVPITPSSYCWGSSSILGTSVSGAGVTYQWFRNGVLIPGGTGATYTATLPGDYTVQITISGACTLTTLSVHVTEFPLPNPVVNYSATSHLFYTGNFYVTYQWYKDAVAIAGATSFSTADIGNGNYKVRVTDTNGCQSVSDAYVFGSTATGVQNVNKTDVSIYPNPAQALVHIEAAMKVRAVISSIDGRSIMDIADAKDINISNLADGVYMIVVYDSNGEKIKTEKLVKATN